MADGRQAQVLTELVNIHENANFVIDRFTDQGQPLGRGDRIVIPDIDAMTIYEDGSVARDASDRNDPGVNELALIVDEEPWIPIQVPKRSAIQNLQGNWAPQIARQGLIMLRNHMDAMIIDDYLAGSVCWLASGVATYHYNPQGESLTPAKVLVARGKALRAKGTFLQNLLWVADSLATAAMMSFAGWRPAESSTTLGPETVGRIYGVPVIETQAVRLQKEFAIATAAVLSGVMTLTFASNPGFVVGQLLRTSGLQSGYDLETPEPVVSVSSNGLTITCAHTGGNDANVLESGAVAIMASAQNMLVDTTHVHKAVQAIPDVEIVKDPETTGEIMQISTLFGFLARVGRVWDLHSPEDDI